MIEDMYKVMGRIHELKKRFNLYRKPPQAPAQEKNFQSQLDARTGAANEMRPAEQDPAAVRGVQSAAAYLPVSRQEQVSRAQAPSAKNRITIEDITRIARESATRNGVPEDLVLSVIKAESGFNPNAVSPRGAKGLMQLMPSVIQAIGVKDPFSPEENIDAGVGLLRGLLDRYNGDYKKALSAYNAGEGAVEINGGVPPYKETQDYVKKVISQYLQNSK
jgi:soluble lytic murein transglycosylase-like protein